MRQPTGPYDHIIELMKQELNIKIRRWRKSMSGIARRLTFKDGTVHNWVEAPYPKTPISLAIFLHECGHHSIGFRTHKLRCVEEYYAWIWALNKMRELGIEPDKRTLVRFYRSMQYGIKKASRRGLKDIPPVLQPFLEDIKSPIAA